MWSETTQNGDFCLQSLIKIQEKATVAQVRPKFVVSLVTEVSQRYSETTLFGAAVSGDRLSSAG